MNKEFLINAMEFCTITRAAEILECEIEDLIHWANIHAISFCIMVDDFVPSGEIEVTIKVPEGDDQRDKVATMIKDVHSREYQFVDTPYSYVGAFSKRPIKLRNVYCDKIVFNADICGFWQVPANTVQQMADGTFEGNIYFQSYDPYGEQCCSVHTKMIPIKLARAHVLVMKPCLIKLFDALYKGETLQSQFFRFANGYKVNTRKKGGKPRTEVAQSDMIKALLCLLPDLKEDIDRSPTLAPEVLDAYLEKNGLARLNLGNNNYRNWMKKAKYNSEN